MALPEEQPTYGAPPEVQNFIENIAPRPQRPIGPPAMDAASHVAPLTAPLDPVAAQDAKLTADLEAPFPTDPRGAAARRESGEFNLPFPLDPRGAAGGQPAMIPVTETETTRTSTGLDKASEANINKVTEEANTAVQAAGQAKVDELKATADLERQQSREAYARGVNNYFQDWGKRQTEDEIVRETTARLEETAKFKPDRSALFHGDGGTMFGISAAIAAMAGGWLMGQGLTGGKNPYLDVIMRMIDQNAQDQVEANSATFRELERRLGSAEAARNELKARMKESVNTTIEAQTRFQKADLIQKGAAAVMAEVDRETARNRMDAAKATARTTSEVVQQRTKMVPNPMATGGIDLADPKEYATTGKVAAMENFAANAQSLAENGDLANAVGFFDSWTGPLARSINASDKDRVAKVEALRGKWELMMRADWKSEPNGQAVQERLSAISWPKNDSEIPLFLQNVREALNTADPGGRYRAAARAMGNRSNAVETGRVPVVR